MNKRNALYAHDIKDEVTVSLVDRRFEIDPKLQTHIDGLWNTALTQPDRHLFDGTVLSVIDIQPARITVCKASYKAFFAQCEEPQLYDDLRVRPLACSGFCTCEDGIVFGLRSTALLLEPDCWEIVPSGTFDAQSIGESDHIDVNAFLQRELAEELGIQAEDTKTGKNLGLFEHTRYKGVDLVIDLKLYLTQAQVMAAFDANENDEYSQLAVVPAAQVSTFINSTEKDVVDVTVALLQHQNLL